MLNISRFNQTAKYIKGFNERFVYGNQAFPFSKSGRLLSVFKRFQQFELIFSVFDITFLSTTPLTKDRNEQNTLFMYSTFTVVFEFKMSIITALALG